MSRSLWGAMALVFATLPVAVAAARSLVSLEVQGPSLVAENFHATFTATAHYDDDSTQDVTQLSTWSFDPGASASFAAPGTLVTGDVGSCEESGTVRAEYDESGTIVAGTHVVTILPTGGAGYALRFDGLDDLAQIPDSATFGWGTQITIEFWANAAAQEAGGRVLAQGDGLDGNSDRAFEVEDDGTLLRYGAVIFLGSSTYVVILAPGAMQPNQWVHCAFTLNTADHIGRAYVNGQVVNEVQSVPSLPIRNSTRPLEIGGNTPWSYFNGALDEVRIWKVARTPQEIAGAMNQRLSGSEPGLAVYWRLDEGSGQAAYDSSPLHNDAFLGSGTGSDSRDPVWIASDAPLGPPPPVHDCNGNGIEDECEANVLPVIESHPTSQAVDVGQPVNFGVVVTGFLPLTYQWRQDGVPLTDGGRISGVSSAVLSITPAWLPDSGSYDVLVSSPCGSVTSDPATLTVNGALGDLNCDGVIDNFDINPFVLALTLPSYYPAVFPNCERMLADCNGDGVVDNFDINAFVQLLVGK